MVRGPDKNEPRMSALSARRKFLPEDTGHLMFFCVCWIVNNSVNARLGDLVPRFVNISHFVFSFVYAGEAHQKGAFILALKE